MRLRKSIAPPTRYEDDEVRDSRPRDPTKPAFPALLRRQSVPLNPNHPAAAFPSLPLTPTDNMNIGQAPSQDATQDKVLEEETTVFKYDHITMESSPEPEDQWSLNSGAEDGEESTSSRPFSPLPPANIWSNLDLAVRYRVYTNLSQNHLPQVVAQLLRLTKTEADEMDKAVRLRREHPASSDEIWDFASTTSGEAPNHIKSDVFIHYSDLMVFASTYEYAFPQHVVQAAQLLQEFGLDADLLGFWFPDPHGSSYLREASTMPLPVIVLPENSVQDSGYSSASDIGQPGPTSAPHASVANAETVSGAEKASLDETPPLALPPPTLGSVSSSGMSMKRRPRKEKPKPLRLRYAKTSQPHPLSCAINATSFSGILPSPPASTTFLSLPGISKPLPTVTSVWSSTDALMTGVLTPVSAGDDDCSMSSSMQGDRVAGSMSLRHRSTLKETEAKAAMKKASEFWGQQRGGGREAGSDSSSVPDGETQTAAPKRQRLTLNIDPTGLATIANAHRSPLGICQAPEWSPRSSSIKQSPGEPQLSSAPASPWKVQHEMDDPIFFARCFQHQDFPIGERNRMLSVHPLLRSEGMQWVIYGLQAFNPERPWNQSTLRPPFTQPTNGCILKAGSAGSVMTDFLITQCNICLRLGIDLAVLEASSVLPCAAYLGNLLSEGTLERFVQRISAAGLGDHKEKVQRHLGILITRLSESLWSRIEALAHDCDPSYQVSQEKPSALNFGTRTTMFAKKLIHSSTEEGVEAPVTPDSKTLGVFGSDSEKGSEGHVRAGFWWVDKDEEKSRKNSTITPVSYGLSSPIQAETDRDTPQLEKTHLSPVAPPYSPISENEDNEEYQAFLGDKLSERQGTNSRGNETPSNRKVQGVCRAESLGKLIGTIYQHSALTAPFVVDGHDKEAEHSKAQNQSVVQLKTLNLGSIIGGMETAQSSVQSSPQPRKKRPGASVAATTTPKAKRNTTAAIPKPKGATHPGKKRGPRGPYKRTREKMALSLAAKEAFETEGNKTKKQKIADATPTNAPPPPASR